MGFAQQILTTVAVTTIVWLVVTFATSPEPMSKLISFYENVEPAGLGWRPVAAAAGLSERKGEIWPNVLNWILGIILVYSTLFGIGEMIFGLWSNTILLLALAAGSTLGLIWNLNRTGWRDSLRLPTLELTRRLLKEQTNQNKSSQRDS